MTIDECRERARQCRVDAARTWGQLQADLFKVAEQWESMADEMVKMQRMRLSVVRPSRAPSDT